jgi:hypothetical protein
MYYGTSQNLFIVGSESQVPSTRWSTGRLPQVQRLCLLVGVLSTHQWQCRDTGTQGWTVVEQIPHHAIIQCTSYKINDEEYNYEYTVHWGNSYIHMHDIIKDVVTYIV